MAETLYTAKYAPSPSLDKLFEGMEERATERRKMGFEKEMLATRQKHDLAQAQQKGELEKMLETERETRLQQREAEKGGQLLNMIGASAGAQGAVVPGVTQVQPGQEAGIEAGVTPSVGLTPEAAKSPLAADFLGKVYQSGVGHQQDIAKIQAQSQADLAKAGGMITPEIATNFREAWSTLKEKGNLFDASLIFPLTVPGGVPMSEVPKYMTVLERANRFKQRDETISMIAKEKNETSRAIQEMKNNLAKIVREDKLAGQDIQRLREIRLGVSQQMESDQQTLEWASRELLEADIGQVDRARILALQGKMRMSIQSHSRDLDIIQDTLRRGADREVNTIPVPAPTGLQPAPQGAAPFTPERAARLSAADKVWKTKFGKKPLNTWTADDKARFEKEVGAELANQINRR